MQLPKVQSSGIGTLGAAGVALMILHITGLLVGWAWPILYVFMILGAIGQENRNFHQYSNIDRK